MLSATFELAHPATDRSALHELLCFSSRMTVLTSLLLCHPLKLVSKMEVLTKAAAAADAEAQLYAAQLRDLGVGTIVQCGRVQDARRQLEAREFDIVLCEQDFHGGNYSGQDLREALRALALPQKSRIVS